MAPAKRKPREQSEKPIRTHSAPPGNPWHSQHQHPLQIRAKEPGNASRNRNRARDRGWDGAAGRRAGLVAKKVY